MLENIYLKKDFKRILVISDLHIPVHHKDSFKFLKKIKKEYKPDLVVNIGDITDLNNFSRYDPDPEFLSPLDEIEQAGVYMNELVDIYPKMILTLGNHDKRIKDKAYRSGIPKECIKDFKDIFNLKKNQWRLCETLRLNDHDERRRIVFTHGRHKNPLEICRDESANVVQGHYHTSGEVRFIANSRFLHWGMNTSCLVREKSTCFRYSRTNRKKFILGVGLVTDNMPIYSPMLLDKKGNWNGKLYLGG